MTYHPKWRSVTNEPILLTEPAFMLIVPQQRRVELEYGASPGDRLGGWFTLAGLVGLVAALNRRTLRMPAFTAIRLSRT